MATPGIAQGLTIQLIQGQQLAPIERPGDGLEEAIRALIAGPTAAERAAGVRSHVPRATRLRSATVVNGVATIDLSAHLVRSRDPRLLQARLAQVVVTATAQTGVRSARVRIKGGTPLGLFPGIDARRPLTRASLAPPAIAPPTPPDTPTPTPTDPADPPPATDPAADATRQLQQRLADLGYLAPTAIDGTPGTSTTAAVIALQKWHGLSRDGVVGPQTQGALESATRPTPITRAAPGRRLEILLDRQLVLAIEDNVVVRALHTSTGTAATPTRVGQFRVYGRFARWWSVPFREYLLWSVAFDGGIALHEYGSVPTHPASHGCVRLVPADARWVYDFVAVGTPVHVIGSSR